MIYHPGWITTIIYPMESSTTITCQVFCHAGSLYESRNTNGLSHFLEHMFFKGGIKYPTSQSISYTLDAIWAEHNAYTSNQVASYYVKSSPEHRLTWLDVLSDMMCHATFPHEEVSKEQWVILQELQMYKDQPRSWMNLNAQLWYHGDNPYGWPILGTQDTIKAVSHDSLMNHKQSLYTKDNMIIVIAGKTPSIDLLLGTIEELFGWLPESSSLSKSIYTGYKPSNHSSCLKQWTNQSHITMFINGIPKTDSRMYQARLLGNMLGGTTSSRLRQEIREKRWLCYYIWSWHSDSKEFWTWNINAWLDKEKLDEWVDIIHTLLDEFTQASITSQEFELAQSNFIWWLQMWMETSDEVADRLGNRYMNRGDIITLNQLIEIYRSITLDEVKQLCAMFDKKYRYLYWIE